MARFLAFFIIVLLDANLIITMAELPLPRKLASHNPKGNVGVSSEAPKASEVLQVSASDEVGYAGAPEQVMPIVHRHHKRPFDKSVCGGGVILGVLLLLFLVSIFCYIRATRRSKVNVIVPESPVSSSGTPRKKVEQCSPPSKSLSCHVQK